MSESDASSSTAEQTSIDLRFWMTVGAACALLAGVFSVSSTVFEMNRPEAKGFTLAMALSLPAILPGIVVVIAFHQLARVIAATPLANSATCVFGSLWVLNLYLAFQELFPAIDIFVTLAASLTLVYLLVAFALNGRGTIWVILGGYLLPKYLGGLLIQGKPFNSGEALHLSMLMLSGISFLIYPIWFGLCALRLRGRIGWSATLLGWIALLELGVFVAFACYALVLIAHQNPPNEDAFVALVDQTVNKFLGVEIGFGVATSLALSMFFLSARDQDTSIHHE